jgi:hypothetical protein
MHCAGCVLRWLFVLHSTGGMRRFELVSVCALWRVFSSELLYSACELRFEGNHECNAGAVDAIRH